ncbi:hypothetical protein [Acinetobacter kyonggiensis]|uniref:Uncharacterized protein n=1 Tax=Acinetobacter kyonggiensis TaxID=595670 RepID=A0A1H3IXE9_9GAMM|nr:hypothetical protein [Acinetobacter kyonggiensis]SDY32400.1 hypothetical protein SAMN05421643_107153 [Acinetobacter kyonggiensis]
MNFNGLQHLFYISFFLLITSPFSHAEELVTTEKPAILYDLFSGTIIQDKDQLILQHCNLAKNQYLLDFKHIQDEDIIRKRLKQDAHFWLSLKASAYEKNERYHLVVDEILDVHLKESCHLSDLLSDLNKL